MWSTEVKLKNWQKKKENQMFFDKTLIIVAWSLIHGWVETQNQTAAGKSILTPSTYDYRHVVRKGHGKFTTGLGIYIQDWNNPEDMYLPSGPELTEDHLHITAELYK